MSGSRSALAVLSPIVVLLVASACQSRVGDQHFDITYDPCEAIVVVPQDDVTPDELASIDEAMAMWNRIGATELTLQDRVGAQRVPILFEEAAPTFFGLYQDETGDVIINRALDAHGPRTITIAHELGHALALRHVPRDERVSVMQTGNLDVPPNEGDAAALEAFWGPCAPDRHHPALTGSGATRR